MGLKGFPFLVHNWTLGLQMQERMLDTFSPDINWKLVQKYGRAVWIVDRQKQPQRLNQ